MECNRVTRQHAASRDTANPPRSCCCHYVGGAVEAGPERAHIPYSSRWPGDATLSVLSTYRSCCRRYVGVVVKGNLDQTTCAGTSDDAFATLVADGHPVFSILELESGFHNRWVTRSLEPGLYLLFAGRRLPPRP
ncbi:unnamed protein product (mitochondrion) [Plasmodiophora brassicae]|uniref:Uncharacterized protein n=1 Tax=Plasmodiophora brassicae TaxID=37360 RepID=A0A3P3Y885_PLABS|nr:unnamed protein product [Plasmodiophora brassicae]